MKKSVVWTVRLAALAGAIGIGACAVDERALVFDTAEAGAALDVITPGAIEHHIRVLSDDSLGGRAPGTAGFEGAARYVESVFTELGLEAAGDDGYRQAVPLLHSTADESSTLSFSRGDEMVALTYAEDFTLSPHPIETTISVEAPVVFVGYGVSAPDLGYDDYGDIDVEGKVVAHLTGAPTGFPSNQRAYYSSGTVKRDEAARRGAVGMISFTYPDDPRFRWQVGVARSRRGSYAWTDGSGAAQGRGRATSVRGSANLNHGAAAALFAGSPTSLEDVFAAARDNEPQAFELPVVAHLQTRTAHRTVDSYNLVARLPGSDPALTGEHMAYVAHVDHFGIGDAFEGDSIYNGAHDNASGTAILMEIARGFTQIPAAQRQRSVLFLVVTAEEWGLLGSDYFISNPSINGDVVGAMSLDMPFLFHPLLDIVPYGAEHSDLSDAVEAAASHLGMDIGPDPIPEQVLFIRSDHYSFIQKGIPSLFIKSGFETGDDRDGGAINTAFRRERYHTPRDEWDQGFDYGAGVSHAQVNLLTGLYVVAGGDRPAWNRGDFFGGLFGAGEQH